MFLKVKTKYRALLSVGAVLSIGNVSALADDLDPSAIFSASHDSVVLIMSFDKEGQPLAIGSGFFVDDGNKVATNFHVVEGASSLRIKSTSGDVQEIENFLAVDVDKDLIVLSVPEEGRPLPLTHREPTIGEDIVAIGNPKGLEGTLSVGIISGIRKDGTSVYYQITAPISPGSSGGPIIDSSGAVLGVSTFYVVGGQNLNFAMPATYIERMLQNSHPAKLSSVVTPASNAIIYTVDERVRVIDPRIDGSLYSPGLQASIVNDTDSVIKNIRLVAVYYPAEHLWSWQRCEKGGYPLPTYAKDCSNVRSPDPLHYKLIRVDDAVPPGLAVRFDKADPTLAEHGGFSASQGKGGWRVTFRILDYEIEESSLEMPEFN